MLNNYKMIKKLENKIKKLEDKISELEEEIPDEYNIRNIADEAVRTEEAELNKVYEVRRDAREEAWDAVTSNIEGIVERRLPAFVEEATKDIQDKLLVELARKAMNMEEKNER